MTAQRPERLIFEYYEKMLRKMAPLKCVLRRIAPKQDHLSHSGQIIEY